MNRAARFCIELCLSAVLLVFPALAAGIDGTVVNRTSGRPQGGATVTLYKLGQAGPEAIQSVKSDAQGHFAIQQDVAGPRLVQAAFDGVTYNHMLPPGAPASGITVDVYDSSSKPGDARVAQHMVLLEPSGDQMNVSEAYIFENNGKLTYNDPENGTLHFYLPASAKGLVKVDCTAPQGMPIQQAAEKTAKADVYKIDFPIKPGETRIDLGYLVPYTSGTTFEGKVLAHGGPTRLVTPPGVTLKGEDLTSLGAEPRTKANIYDVKGGGFKVQIEGTGTLHAAAGADDSSSDQDSGPQIESISPRIFGQLPFILALALGILALGFVLLYRIEQPASEPSLTVKVKHERRRR